MMLEQWAAGPVGVDAVCRTVLVVVPFAGMGTRLLDVLPLIEADHRILTVFTVPPTPGVRPYGAEEFVRANACRVLPWQEAVQYEFDLVLAANLLPLPGDARPESGDICYDRLLASIPFRAGYRRALGLAAGQQLVVAAVGSRPDVVDRLVNELPQERYRIAAIAPPDVWAVHGGFQVRAWFADALHGGLALLPPEEDWRGALIAADLVIGDHGAVTRYGAALGLPTMLAAPADVRPDPVTESLCRHAPRLDPERPLPDQVHAAMRQDRTWQDALLPWISIRPGEAGQLLRKDMYELLDLDEPARAVPCSPVPLPRPVRSESLWWRDCVRHYPDK